MAGSSELSDALNPKYSTRRPHVGTQIVHNDVAYLPSPTQQHQLISNNLSVHNGSPIQQDAFIFSPLTPDTASSVSSNGQSPVSRPVTVKQRQDPVQLLRNIMASLSDQKHAFEVERERRLAWEAEQESKAARSQADFERRIASIQKEIDDLRSRVPPTPDTSVPASLVQDSSSQPQVVHDPPLVVYSFPTPAETNRDDDEQIADSIHIKESPVQRAASTASVFSLELPSDPPVPEFVQGSSTSPSTASADEQPRKRLRTKSPSQDLSAPSSTKPRSRNQPRSIQAAMRSHLLTCMGLDHDKNLPPSFIQVEGEFLLDDEPVRFVWDQTTRKCVHNGHMKKRVVSDMILNKAQYPLVPVHEFTKEKLDSVFEQAFTTFRTKFASQSSARQGDDGKAQKARRQGRKKIKLGNRVTTRKLFQEYSGTFFDPAFQMDCMSSEESSGGEEEEDVHSDDDRPKGYLKIRCLAWRSSRLQKLYELIDEREEFERSQKPRRGVGRKDRFLGDAKDGNPLPPSGVFKWMVSKKWYRESLSRSAHVASILEKSVLEDGEAAWMSLAPLGPESDDEDNVQPPMEFSNPYYGPSPWTGGLGFVDMPSAPPS